MLSKKERGEQEGEEEERSETRMAGSAELARRRGTSTYTAIVTQQQDSKNNANSGSVYLLKRPKAE
jgi:hypothetical protein